MTSINDTQSKQNTTPDNKNENKLTGGLYLQPVDRAVLVFSTLLINLFSLAVPLMTLQVYDRILAFHSTGTLQVLVAGVCVIVVLDVLLKLCRGALIGWTSARFEHAAYTGVIEHVMRARIPALRKLSPGEQLQRISAIAKLKSFYSGQSLISLIDLPFVVIFLAFIAYLGGGLVLVPLVLLALFGAFAVFIGDRMKKSLRLRDIADDRRINFVSEILSHIHTVKMLGLESAFQRRHEFLHAQSIDDSHALNAQNTLGYNAAALFTQTMIVAMISIGALMVLDGQITMGVLIACVLLSGRIMQPIQRALSFWIGFQDYQLARGKINELFALPAQPTDREIVGNKDPKGRLDITKLTFGYHEDKALFHGLDFSLAAGKAIALVGPPGDGKTTLMKLIAALHEPDTGTIEIDGLSVGNIPKAHLARFVGYLSSDAVIFQGSIMGNLTGFRPELEDQALEIAGYLGIDKVVSKLAAGYNTELFNGPADPITPGMKQRLSLARVLTNRPRILLFDHADKSLDKEGYNHMFKLLGQLRGQATMILSSNDRNILHLAQEEYLIQDGKLVRDQGQFHKGGDIVRPFKELRA